MFQTSGRLLSARPHRTRDARTVRHELGRVEPCAYLDPDKLGPTARRGEAYGNWLAAYKFELEQSREDFLAHHHAKYGGVLPVWAAVELLGRGGLTRLFGFAPRGVQDTVTDVCGLSAPQLTSWLKALTIVRNTCAYHGRLFNRVQTLSPRLPRWARIRISMRSRPTGLEPSAS